MNYRVRIYAAKRLVREKGFRGFVLAMDYFQRQCRKFTAEEGISIYLEEKDGTEWMTRSHRVGKQSIPDSGNALNRELPK